MQISGMGPIDEELEKILDGEGLKVRATRTSFPQLQNEFEKVIEDQKFWNVILQLWAACQRSIKMRKATEDSLKRPRR